MSGKIVVFDLDNTLVDEWGRMLRPGIVDLLLRLRREERTLLLWTNSTRTRAQYILRTHGLDTVFQRYLYREDYDPENAGLRKDIRQVEAEFIVDDDLREIAFAESMGLTGYQITPYRNHCTLPPDELNVLYAVLSRRKSWIDQCLASFLRR